jgi:hypothetical protein
MFTHLLLLYRNKAQWAFKYPGQVTPPARKDPVKGLKSIMISIFTNAQLLCMEILDHRLWTWLKAFGIKTQLQDVYENGWEIEMLRIIRNSLNMLLDIKLGNEEKHRNSPPSIYVGGYASTRSVTSRWGNVHAFPSLYALPGTHRKISKVESFLQDILCRHVDMLWFVTGLVWNYS